MANVMYPANMYGNNYNGYQTYQNQQSYNNTTKGMEWVEGFVGATAFQMPYGWPVNTPIALWDQTARKIYLKSWNQMGMANPMQELDYTIKEQKAPPMLAGGMSGDTPMMDMSQYATRQEFEELHKEIKELHDMMAANTKESKK